MPKLLERRYAVKLSLTEQAQTHIAKKGGRVAVDLVCVST